MTDAARPGALTSVPAEMLQVGADLDLQRVLQSVTDTGTRLSGARFGAFFYNAVDTDGEMYRLHVVSGAEAASFAKMPSPRITELFEPTFSGEHTVRVDDLVEGPYRGHMPRGHLPVRSYLATPVIGRDGTVIGSLLFGHQEPGMFDERTEEIVGAVAAQAAIAVENAQLFEQEQAARRDAEDAREQLRRHVAELTEASLTLQRSLLPADLPDVPGVTTAVRYLPAVAHAEVGGDWYDVIATGETAVTLAIGDVQGHNMQAAAEMGRLRTTLRAYLAEGHSPAEALARTNKLTTSDSEALLATCCLISVDLRSGEGVIVRAGHPLPMLHRADGTVVELGALEDSPLGLFPDETWKEERIRLCHGDRIVLYTDGLVDLRGTDMAERIWDLATVVEGVARLTPEEAADEILRNLGRRDEDDVALVVCDITPLDHLVTVDAPEKVRLARSLTADQLEIWSLPELAPPVMLVVTELVTNTLQHGGGVADLVLRRTGSGVRIEVTDSDLDGPALVAADPDAEGQRGILLVDAMVREWGVDVHSSGKTVWAELDPR
ncbi:SpoIIE family protein phosphatase [Nocardioides sp. YIM 152315]|uniref:SpoIIE family protein phosphatase n=1 Tax=Nocardioides sp. YIM 152315 TaxID=3031760 RepID=UPI0023D9C432|nr:SpoIIE family protein phosphatase [Nocardioides sp. YIM 152315]MDF1602640.1 SpoIIE family protein phosphatase [Nocardioides sp. YIM 152315]